MFLPQPQTAQAGVWSTESRCGSRTVFQNLQSQGKNRKTIRAYKLAIEEFRQSCTKKFIDEIRKQDLIDFMGWLRTPPPKLRKDGTPRKPRRSGDPNRTHFNKVNDIVIFLSAHGINRLLKKSEYPKFAEKPVVYYDAEQVKALYAAAKDDEERFMVDYFLKTGVRDGEAAHAEYSDVKGGFSTSCLAAFQRSIRYHGLSNSRSTRPAS